MEGNIFPVHAKCHAKKTKKDVAEKAMIASKKQKHHGIEGKKQKIKNRGFSKMQVKEKLPLPRPIPMYEVR